MLFISLRLVDLNIYFCDVFFLTIERVQQGVYRNDGVFFLLWDRIKLFQVYPLYTTFSVKEFSKSCHPNMAGHNKMISRTSKTPISTFWTRYSLIKINSIIELAHKNRKAKTSTSTWNFLLTKIQFFIVLVFCNYLDTWYIRWLLFYTRYVLFVALPYRFF